MYDLYCRYSLAPRDSWRLVDSYGSMEAALEAMKYPVQHLLDDTLLRLFYGNQVVAFGMVQDGIGRQAPALTSAKILEMGKYYDFMAKCGVNWNKAWAYNDNLSWVLWLAYACCRDRRKLVTATCEMVRSVLRTDDPYYSIKWL